MFTFIGLISCEKVIEVDLNDADKAIVIEASITNEKQPYILNISKTSSFFSSKSGNKVSGATVSVRVDKGKPRFFNELSPGVYVLDRTVAFAGYWYIIDVEYEGIIYSAKSFLNEAVPIVDLGFSYFDGYGFFDSGYKVSCYIREPGDKVNFYRIKYFVNGKLITDKGESLYTDKLINGKEIGIGQRTLVFNESDTLTVELQSIDKNAYEYFSTLENIISERWQQNASPANPISNFNNGALGYFSAYSFSRKTVIIKDYIRKN